jgi:hypothetical protein
MEFIFTCLNYWLGLNWICGDAYFIILEKVKEMRKNESFFRAGKMNTSQSHKSYLPFSLLFGQ